MEAKAIYRYARTSAQKVREVTREVQGLDVSKALALLAYTPKKAALLIGKTLQSAIANATHNYGMNEENLFIRSCTATDGGMLKRIMPRARGSAAPIKKRMCHITVIVAHRNEAGGAAAAPVAETAPVDDGKPAAKKAAKKAATKKAKAAEGGAAKKRATKAKAAK